MKFSLPSVAVVAATLVPSLAAAHTGLGPSGGFTQGLMHPVSGLDHVLAMVLVGLFAFQLGGRAMWLAPLAFVLAMAVGGASGTAGIAAAVVEAGIALSVVVLGAAVALGVKAPPAAAAGLVGLFAIFHGHAHGAETPAGATALAFAAGFMAATALLHAVGIGLGFAVSAVGDRHGRFAVRTAGAVFAFVGVGLVAGVV